MHSPHHHQKHGYFITKVFYLNSVDDYDTGNPGEVVMTLVTLMFKVGDLDH